MSTLYILTYNKTLCRSGCYIPTAWAYVGEFFTTRRRGFMVMLWAVSSELGHVSLSVIGWLLLGTLLGDSRAFTVHGFSFSKWRVFLILVSISSLLACVLVCFLPESPEYLITVSKQQHNKTQPHAGIPTQCMQRNVSTLYMGGGGQNHVSYHHFTLQYFFFFFLICYYRLTNK